MEIRAVSATLQVPIQAATTLPGPRKTPSADETARRSAEQIYLKKVLPWQNRQTGRYQLFAPSILRWQVLSKAGSTLCAITAPSVCSASTVFSFQTLCNHM